MKTKKNSNCVGCLFIFLLQSTALGDNVVGTYQRVCRGSGFLVFMSAESFVHLF